MPGISMTTNWSNPRYQAALQRLIAHKSAPGGVGVYGEGWTGQPQKSFSALHDKLIAETVGADTEAKLAFGQLAREKQQAEQGLDLRRKYLGLDKYRFETTKYGQKEELRLGRRKLREADRMYPLEIGLGVGGLVVDEYVARREKKRAAEREEQTEEILKKLRSI